MWYEIEYRQSPSPDSLTDCANGWDGWDPQKWKTMADRHGQPDEQPHSSKHNETSVVGRRRVCLVSLLQLPVRPSVLSYLLSLAVEPKLTQCWRPTCVQCTCGLIGLLGVSATRFPRGIPATASAGRCIRCHAQCVYYLYKSMLERATSRGLGWQKRGSS